MIGHPISVDDSTFRFNRIGLRVLGIPLVEDEYYNSLFDMHHKPFIHVLSEELDKTIDNAGFSSDTGNSYAASKRAEGIVY